MNLPPPLIAEPIDLAGNDWLPLYHVRLRKSRWWRTASHLARSINVDLWCEAYTLVPAGTLPDDDVELADISGYGRDLAGWLAVKAEVMAPWILCSDGRWHHPTLAEVVLDGWERMGDRRKGARIRQQRRRALARENLNVTAKTASVTRDTPHVSRVTPPAVTREIDIQDKTGQDTDQAAAPAARPAPVDLPVPPPDQAPVERDGVDIADPDFLAFWNAATRQMRRRSSQAKTITQYRKARKRHAPSVLHAALLGYLAGDEDVKRTGGPGLHTWIVDKLEHWIGSQTAEVSEGRWRIILDLVAKGEPWGEELGPRPGQPGCRVPPHLLLRPAGERRA